jgi:hypothetical protein
MFFHVIERETKSCKVFVGFVLPSTDQEASVSLALNQRTPSPPSPSASTYMLFFEIPVEGERYQRAVKKHMRIFAKGHKLAQIGQSHCPSIPCKPSVSASAAARIVVITATLPVAFENQLGHMLTPL